MNLKSVSKKVAPKKQWYRTELESPRRNSPKRALEQSGRKRNNPWRPIPQASKAIEEGEVRLHT